MEVKPYSNKKNTVALSVFGDALIARNAAFNLCLVPSSIAAVRQSASLLPFWSAGSRSRPPQRVLGAPNFSLFSLPLALSLVYNIRGGNCSLEQSSNTPVLDGYRGRYSANQERPIG